MPKKPSPEKKPKNAALSKEDVVLHALRLAQDFGWGQITLQDIAQAADVPLGDLHTHIDDKDDILIALGKMIDRKVLAQVEAVDDNLPARDRLFDVMMERFDVLNDHRDGIIAIIKSFRGDPKQAVISMPHLCRSMAWMMEAAGLDTSGFLGAAKVAGLSIVYLDVLRIWVKDDSPDMGKTMAALDKDLGRAEQCANTFGF